jgi:3'-phosphoadenosine 5'-phosphosulfate (PAPS) 3'-phosphatase
MRDADTFGVMIGLLKAGIPVLGVTYRPRIDS